MRDQQVYDVAVVGAGPAGCAAALRVLQQRPGASVVLLDAAAFPRDKTCGDGVAPHALDVFASLGVDGLDAGFPPVPVLALRAPSGRVTARPMARPARVIPRRVLDARLVAAATERGGELRRHRVRRVDVRPDHVVLDGQIAARVVVGADGANSAVLRQVQAERSGERRVAVALRGYARVTGTAADRLLIAVSSRDCPSYAWSFPLPDGMANVGFGVFREAVPLTRAHLLERLVDELPGVVPDPATVRAHHLPLTTGRPSLPDGRVLLVGDAAGLVNPLTGEGIYYAALSGAVAGDAAAAGAGAGVAYRAGLERRLRQHHWHTAALAALARSPRFVEAAVLAATGRRTFDDVVELGLAGGVVRPRTLGALGARASGACCRAREGRRPGCVPNRVTAVRASAGCVTVKASSQAGRRCRVPVIDDDEWSAPSGRAAEVADALDSRAVVEQAKGVVAAVDRCTPDEGFSRLAGLATDHDLRVLDLARCLVALVSATRVADLELATPHEARATELAFQHWISRLPAPGGSSG